MRKYLILLAFFLIGGCGYAVGGFRYDGEKIVVSPTINKIDITAESRKYSTYQSYPVLLEDELTNAIIRQFNIDGHLKVVSSDPQALNLKCFIVEYRKSTLRYTDDDDPEEQRLRLIVTMQLISPTGDVLEERKIQGETEYFLIGRYKTSEETAQRDLVDDAARRIVEAVVEKW